MAQSRVDRVGTIFSRVKALIEGGAMRKENIPLWYDVYAAFPPKIEPFFGRERSTEQIRQIFYPEDIIRAKFHRDVKLKMIGFDDNITETQTFLIIYESFKEDGLKDEEAYTEALKSYKMIYG